MPSRWKLTTPLRSWQAEALDAWHKNGHRGVASVVTGGGKTIYAYACMEHLLNEKPDAHVLIIVPTVALLDQWTVGLVDDFGVQPDQMTASGGGKRPPKRPARFNVMVINTARDVAPRYSLSTPTFLVVDECHRSASAENSRSLSGAHIATLGLSATPERDFDDLFSEVVAPALGPIIYTYNYTDARRDEVISPFHLSNLRVPMTEDEQREYNALTRRILPLLKRRDKGADVEDRLHRLLRNRARVSTNARSRLPTAVRLVENHARERAIIFHEQIDAADIITQTLANRGHRVGAYHSRLGPSLRQDNLRLFRRGELDVIVTCRALDEGINVPDASVAIIAASTASTRQRIQRLGRVLRPAGGKDLATIYTLYASEPEAERLRSEERNLEGASGISWHRLEVK